MNQCKNYKLCQNMIPFNKCLCICCDLIFGEWNGGNKNELQTYGNYKCSYCLIIKETIEQPKCEHMICIKCYRTCYYEKNSKKYCLICLR